MQNNLLTLMLLMHCMGRHVRLDGHDARLQICLERCDVHGSLLVRKNYKAAVIELSGRHLTVKISPKQVPLPGRESRAMGDKLYCAGPLHTSANARQ